VAARLSAAAAGGETLLTATTKAAAGQVKNVELRRAGAWRSGTSVGW
jgi:class 3 adenylate cyclase